MSNTKKGKITDLEFDDKNFNLGSEYGAKLLDNSFTKFGAGRSVLVDKNNRLIAGNKSAEMFGQLGNENIIIVETTGDELVVVKRTDIDLDSQQGREMALADNQVSKINFVLAEEVLAETLTAEVCEAWGVKFENEVKEIASEDEFDGLPPSEPITILGDLYEIGEHRLLCGDSTDSDQVAKLMNGEKANMVFTDPPYGYKYESNHQDKHKELLNDDKILNFLPNGFLFSNDNTAFYVFCGWQTLKEWLLEIENAGLQLKNIIIWKKNNWSMGDLKGAYGGQYEIILFAHKGRVELKNGRGQDIWEFDRVPPKEHPTMKPIDLIQKAIKDVTEENQVILDLFLGSGSTMVASHQLKRKCYGMELDPKYCDVIVSRMIKLDDTLTIKRNAQVLSKSEIEKFTENTSNK